MARRPLEIVVCERSYCGYDKHEAHSYCNERRVYQDDYEFDMEETRCVYIGSVRVYKRRTTHIDIENIQREGYSL
jgi:hypothetical protein